MRKRIVSVLLALCLCLGLLPIAALAAPAAEIGNGGYPYGKAMSGTSLTLVVEAEGAAAYQWQSAAAKNGPYTDLPAATEHTLALSQPPHGTWYRCLVDGTASKAVQVVAPGEDSRTWTGSSGSYYISNGTMAYRVSGTEFDVTGLYRKEGTDYMLRTSFNTRWTMYSSTQAEPEAGGYFSSSYAVLDALRVAFSGEDDYAVLFEADPADGQQAFSFGCDTQLGNYSTSGWYADDAALIAEVEEGSLTQVAMIGAASKAAATATDPAFVIAPDEDTPADRFWIGKYYHREVYAYNTTDDDYTTTETIDGTEVVTRIEGDDSGMTMSWLNVDDEEPIKFKFAVGSVEDTGAAEPDPVYTVSFDVQDIGIAPDPIENVTAGSTIDEPDEPTAAGHTFGGWYKEASCTNKWNFLTYTVNNDITLYAKWEENFTGESQGPSESVPVHTVIFMVGDEEFLRIEDILHGDTLANASMPIPDAPEGYEFADWYTEDGTHVRHGMVVEEDLIAYATWEPVEEEADEPDYVAYRIKATASEGGKISPKGSVYVREGSDRKFTITPGDGYVIETVLADGKNKGAVSEYRFEDVDDDHTIEAIFRKLCSGTAKDDCPSLNYSDLDTSLWYHEAVDYVLENGIMVGYDGRFEPHGTLSRAQVATILWRLEGCPLADNVLSYTDVPANQWYTEAVRWTTRAGIVEGWNGCFFPDAPITHEQLITILHRYAGHKGLRTTAGQESFLLYADAAQVSLYAVPAMQWACERGIITGADTLAPQAVAQRCVAAQMLANFSKL